MHAGLTRVERDRLIMHLRGSGYSQAEIASYPGMTQPAIHCQNAKYFG
jgi:hypothetical protein